MAIWDDGRSIARFRHKRCRRGTECRVGCLLTSSDSDSYPARSVLRMDRVALSAVIGSAVETSRPLIEAARHELTVEGPGKGSEFVVHLPLASVSHVLSSELVDDPAPAAHGLTRVLLVDDRDGADSLRVLLELLGAEIQVVYVGPTALDACYAYQPEVVLLDISMPGMNGSKLHAGFANAPNRRTSRSLR